MAGLSWELVGGDPAPGDPGAFQELARDFTQRAADAREAHSVLSGLTTAVDEGVWRGQAGDAFRGELGELPPQLAKLHDSYAAAAEAMAGYARVLGELQAQAGTLLAQAEAAQADQVAYQRARDQAQAQDPTVPTDGYEQAIADAQRRLATAQGEIAAIGERRVAAEGAVIASLEQARDLGVAGDRWYQRVWDAVERWVDEHADLLRDMAGALRVVGVGLVGVVAALTPILRRGEGLAGAVAGGGFGGESKAGWQRLALARAGIDPARWDPDKGVRANDDIVQAVYRYYGQLYLDHPQLQWAGMANLVGPTFYAAWQDLYGVRHVADEGQRLKYLRQLLRRPPLPDWVYELIDVAADLPFPLSADSLAEQVTSEELAWFEAQFLRMHKEIFADLAWQHEPSSRAGWRRCGCGTNVGK